MATHVQIADMALGLRLLFGFCGGGSETVS